jgi:hypothetical protein
MNDNLELDIVELEDRFDMSADLWSVAISADCGNSCGNNCCKAQ